MSKLRRRFKQEFGNPPLYDHSGSISRLGNHWGAALQGKLEKLQAIAEYNNLEGVWWDHIDPKLSQEENVDILLEYTEKGLPPELEEKYEGEQHQRQNEYQKFKSWEEEQESASSSKDRRGELGDDIDTKTLGDNGEPTEHNAADDNTTSADEQRDDEVKDYSPEQSGDEWGYATIGRAPLPLLEFLDRAKAEFGFSSRREVIEHLIAHQALTDNFRGENGNLWREWHKAIESSNISTHIPVNDEDLSVASDDE